MSQKHGKDKACGSPPLGHEWVETEDNSLTLWSEKFEENCHSLSGARAETRYNFIEGCELSQLTRAFDPVNILEVGFGLGVGFEETLRFWREHSLSDFHFVSFECDRELIKQIVDSSWKYREEPTPHFSWEEQGENYLFRSLILLGDARETITHAPSIEQFPREFHAIFQDPFSPKKNPELWTREWFQKIRFFCHDKAILSTYSASHSVRKALIEGGWSIENRAGFKQKKSSTRAFLDESRGDISLMESLKRARVSSLSDTSLKLNS